MPREQNSKLINKRKKKKKKGNTDFLPSFEILLKVVSGLIFVLLLLLVLVDLEVAQLVALLGVGHDPQPVPEVVLFQILLGEVLQVPDRDEEEGETIIEILVKRRSYL